MLPPSCFGPMLALPDSVGGEAPHVDYSCEGVRHEDGPEHAQGAVLGVTLDVLHTLPSGYDQAHDASGKLGRGMVSFLT